METIKLSELIKMIEEGKTPNIIVDDIEYKYEEGDYYDLDTCETLFEAYTLEQLVDYRTKIELKKEPILTNKEKEYLSAVIKPFRDKISYITKSDDIEEYEFLYIIFKDDDKMAFKNFEKGKYYKNMKLYEYYSLEELGL